MTSPSGSTQPNSYDIVDTEYFSLKKLVPSGNLSAMDAKKIKNFDKITPAFTKGELPNGKKIRGQGTAPWKVMFLEGPTSTKFAPSQTQWATRIPTAYNADTLGTRPDLIKRPIDSWAGTAQSRVQGKSSHPRHSIDRHYRCCDGDRSRGRLQISR
jgi:putative spermidine/putrescine transport system substrate-binding protein